MIEGDNLHIEDLAQKYDIFLMDMDGVLVLLQICI